MKAHKISITKQAFKEAKNRFVIVSLPLSIFAFLTIGVFVLGFFVPLTLFFTIPFIVIPSFFAVSAINVVAPNKNTHEFLGFFYMFRAYFSPIFRGGYRVILGFLKSLLAFIISSLIVSIILVNTILVKDPGYIVFTQEIQSISDANLLIDAINKFVETNQTFNNIMYIQSIVSVFCGYYVFVHHLSINGFKYNYNFGAKLPLPIQDLNLIHKNVHKKTLKPFYKDYFRLNWFLILILIGGYVAGSLIAFFFLPQVNMVQSSIIGVFGSFVLLLLFIPYYLCGSQIMFSKYKNEYVNNLIELSISSLNELKKNNSISEEKEKEVLKILESQKDEEKIDNDSDDKTEMK